MPSAVTITITISSDGAADVTVAGADVTIAGGDRAPTNLDESGRNAAPPPLGPTSSPGDRPTGPRIDRIDPISEPHRAADAALPGPEAQIAEVPLLSDSDCVTVTALERAGVERAALLVATHGAARCRQVLAWAQRVAATQDVQNLAGLIASTLTRGPRARRGGRAS